MTGMRHAIVAAAAGGALLLGGCSDTGGTGGSGGSGGMNGMDHGSPSASARPGQDAVAGSFNDADVTFAQMMIPHHRQALDMARLAPSRASDPELKRLARQIEKAQDPEITTMRGWLKSWGRPAEATPMPGMGHSEHGGEGGGMEGMMSDADMERLRSLEGERFDRAFAEMMIDHHEGAISMAEEELRAGKNAEAKELARAIAKTQAAEVRRLEGILDRL